MTSRISPWCATLVWSTHGLVSAFFHVGRQFGASRPNTLACGLRKRPWSFLMGVTIVTPNNECEQTGFGRSTVLFSSARSRLTSRISPWCATLVWSTHGLVSAFFYVRRQFGTSRPNTLACGLRKRPRSFLMGVTIVTPDTGTDNQSHDGRLHVTCVNAII